jgi:glycosyltransferase involved in cell wall biosynthesis
MQAFTGHCAHSLTCRKWKSGCGECPFLSIYPAIPVDTTASLWQDKRLIYAHCFFQLVAPSRWLSEKVKQSIVGHQPSALIYNGVNTDTFKPFNKAKVRQKFNLPSDAILVGGVADQGLQANVFKGGAYMVEVIKALCARESKCFFLSIGAAGHSGTPRIINIPRVENETELAMLYSCLDIYLLTSIAENCPLVVLEAMACGVPVAAFAAGGVPELVRDHIDGFVVAWRNTALLTEAVVKLAQDSDRRQKFSQSARQRAVTRFNHQCIARRYEILYMHFIDLWADTHRHLSPLPLREVPNMIKTTQFLEAYRKVNGFHSLRLAKQSDFKPHLNRTYASM